MHAGLRSAWMGDDVRACRETQMDVGSQRGLL